MMFDQIMVWINDWNCLEIVFLKFGFVWKSYIILRCSLRLVKFVWIWCHTYGWYVNNYF